jgi:hypothetical protein
MYLPKRLPKQRPPRQRSERHLAQQRYRQRTTPGRMKIVLHCEISTSMN